MAETAWVAIDKSVCHFTHELNACFFKVVHVIENINCGSSKMFLEKTRNMNLIFPL